MNINVGDIFVYSSLFYRYYHIKNKGSFFVITNINDDCCDTLIITNGSYVSNTSCHLNGLKDGYNRKYYLQQRVKI